MTLEIYSHMFLLQALVRNRVVRLKGRLKSDQVQDSGFDTDQIQLTFPV